MMIYDVLDCVGHIPLPVTVGDTCILYGFVSFTFLNMSQ